eukprot:TRINITY_DN33555_c0_g1_i1.p1 TRINITY_DN33555_c0_g1~~TRINITY_DN33555_c0_g1_i1.p1  ORF type:complete len:413 (-),score=46.53 TRINITY_DN33555_c0_g1_i1:12-1250(-)
MISRACRHLCARPGCFAPSSRVLGYSRGFCEANGLVSIAEERFDELVRAEVAYLANVPVLPVTTHQVLEWSDPHDMVPFIQSEVPKRFAVRIRLIENLVGWKEVPELVKMHEMLNGWYRQLVVLQYDPGNLKVFLGTIKEIRDEGRDVIGLSATGIFKLKQRDPHRYTDEFLDRWLDAFLLSRISTNALADQFVAIASKADGGLERPSGIASPSCDASKICEHAAYLSSYLCYQYTGQEPVFRVENYKAGSIGPQNDSPCTFAYIPSYLRYIMCELLKNSFQATVKTSTNPADVKSRPVNIHVCRDEQRVAILVSDQAGGIPLEIGEKIWSYTHGAASRLSDNGSGATSLGGFGVGLPCARLYARYLGGKLSITSYPGMGTQAHLLLPRIVAHQKELLVSSETPLAHDSVAV